MMELGRLIIAISMLGLFSACPVAVGADGSTDVTGTIPLTATDVAASGITQTTATIAWNTNGNATSQVFYDTVSHDIITDYPL